MSDPIGDDHWHEAIEQRDAEIERLTTEVRRLRALLAGVRCEECQGTGMAPGCNHRDVFPKCPDCNGTGKRFPEER